MDLDELRLLEASQADKTQLVEVVVNGCAYACCGKGWQRRDGYEQTYYGYVDNLTYPQLTAIGADGELTGMHGTFMLYAAGLGTLSYVIAVRFFEVEAVSPAP